MSMTDTPLAICRLCQQERKLCHSHIVPELLYQPLYNDEHKFMGITGQGNKGWKPLPKGIREHLLCFDCEQLLNDKYEKPFMEQQSLPDRIELDSAYTAVFNYPTIKLFNLSILFRASVSSLQSFRGVNLGAHEERIRQMLLSGDTGEIWE